MRPTARLLTLAATAAAVALLLAACQSRPPAKDLPPLQLAPAVDLPRFMGDWYVIASIPTMFEKDAYGAVESYRLDPDGTVATTFSYRAGGFDGPVRSLRSRGFVLSPDNTVWGQQYIWPIRADYRISYVADDYSQTVITREKRDYAWILARTPTLPEADLQRLIDLVGRQGYDTSKLIRVPQKQP